MKSAVMFGAGNVGRGFLGQLFTESGYETTFIDVDEELVATLDSRGCYNIQVVDNQLAKEVEVRPVHALNAHDKAAIAQALAQADIAATAVGVHALADIAPMVAQGIVQRCQQGNSHALNIIICENLKDAAAVFHGMVAQHIPADILPCFEANVGFVNTVIGRMVPPPTLVMHALDPTLIAVEPYKELPVDRNGFIGPIPSIVGMQACDNFGAYTARKLYIHNCGHAVLAYLGYLRGFEYAYQALQDPTILHLLEAALDESIAGIVAAYQVQPDWLKDHANDLLHRFANQALGDTIFRLGRDPARKLAPEDRLVGAARLAEKAGVKPEAISWGIAAAFRFDPPEDDLAMDLQKKLSKLGLNSLLSSVSGIQPGEQLADLVFEKYERLGKKEWPRYSP